MSSSLHAALTSAALAGLLAGLTACGDSGSTTAPEAAAPAPEAAPAAPTAAATEQPAKAAEHACKGMNECKAQGGCHVEGKNSCAGLNECKGQGGCCTHADRTQCPSADAKPAEGAAEPAKAG